MATKKKAKKKAAKKKAARKPAAKKSAARKTKAVAKKNDLRGNLDKQMQEVRAAVEDLGKEFEIFRDGLSRSSRALMQGVMGFREALMGGNALSALSLREAARRLSEGVQRFVRALQGN